ncbi:MAG TPA: cystatin domain-containing protein [Syntrophobacteraceae bacterium]|nr:cystatin domain-containing protein [Syntrophobacteraceae bacterium]
MKLKSLLLIVLVSVAVSSTGSCQDMAEPRIPRAGGWFPASVDEPEVRAAADRAVAVRSATAGEELKLIAVREARSQVVAGRNFELVLAVERNGKRVSAKAVVWAKLDGTYQLTQWSWEK